MPTTMFFPLKMATANAVSIAGNLEGDANGDELLDYNPDNGLKTNIAAATPDVDVDRDALASSGALTDGGTRAVMLYLRNPDAFTGSAAKINIYSANNTAWVGSTLHGQVPFITMSEDNPIAVFFWSGAFTNRYWKMRFSSLPVPADIGMVGYGNWYLISPRHVHEQPDTTAQFNSGITTPGGTHFSRSERSVGSRRLTMRFEMITEADLNTLRAVYALARGSHYPFVVAIDTSDANPIYDGRLYRFAPQSDVGLVETPITFDMWTVELPLEEIKRTPAGYDW